LQIIYKNANRIKKKFVLLRKYRFNKEVLLSVVYISEKRNFGFLYEITGFIFSGC